MNEAPKPESTYAQYCRLRIELGFDPDTPMKESVWGGCLPDAQENMLAQLRNALGFKDRYVAQHGEVW